MIQYRHKNVPFFARLVQAGRFRLPFRLAVENPATGILICLDRKNCGLPKQDAMLVQLVEACWNTATKSALTPLLGSSRAASSATLKCFCCDLNRSLHRLEAHRQRGSTRQFEDSAVHFQGPGLPHRAGHRDWSQC